MSEVITDHPERRRYELYVDDQLAVFVNYGRNGGLLALTHTETLDDFAGHGLGTTLVAHVIGVAQEEGLAVLPFCPFVKHYMLQHPESLTLVPAHQREHFGLFET